MMSPPAPVALIDYGSGNLHSAGKALERAARESGTNKTVLVTADPEVVRRADRVVLPGVGAYADCRRGLDAVPGMVEALTEVVRERGRPFLGICVGLQLMATRGLEHGVTGGLGWIEGDVTKIVTGDSALKIPHMGWNSLEIARPHPILEGFRPVRRGWTPISSTPTTSRPRTPPTSSRRAIMAAPSPR